MKKSRRNKKKIDADEQTCVVEETMNPADDDGITEHEYGIGENLPSAPPAVERTL